MANSLGLMVEASLAVDIQDCVVDACRLACDLRLAWVAFKANDYKFTCYPNWTAQRWKVDGADGRDVWTSGLGGGTWKHFPAIKEPECPA